MESALVRMEAVRGVATLTLDSPHNRNALSGALVTQLAGALADATADGSVRVIALTHTGPVFCSGVDLKDPGPVAAHLGDLLADVAECPKPVVVRVGGPARAGGIGLLAAADLAVCSEDATFAFTEVRLGVIPAVISATVLPRLTSRAAAELFLTGNTFDGRRAAQVGLVTAAVPADRLDATVADLCAALVRGAPRALAGTKDLLRRPGLRADLAALTELSVGYFGSDEGREGIAAFWEKRDAGWIP